MVTSATVAGSPEAYTRPTMPVFGGTVEKTCQAPVAATQRSRSWTWSRIEMVAGVCRASAATVHWHASRAVDAIGRRTVTSRITRS